MLRRSTLGSSSLRAWVKPGFALAIVVYFGYHIIQGNHGVLAWNKLNKHLIKAQEELKTLKTTQEQLEHRVRLLRPESLDPDMLEERARLILNFSNPP